MSPLDIAVNQVTNKIYITNGKSGTVSVIDSNSGSGAKDIRVGDAPNYAAGVRGKMLSILQTADIQITVYISKIKEELHVRLLSTAGTVDSFAGYFRRKNASTGCKQAGDRGKKLKLGVN